MVREPSPSDEGSTARLLRLCAGYFVFYVLTGLSVKYFLGSAASGFPGMSDLEYLVYSTAGGNLVCVGYAVARGWHRLQSDDRVTFAGRSFPRELLWIVPSGVCTAVVVPTTTLMYTLPVSVMVAMVIMRGAIIVISRLVDALQIRQGILRRKVYGEENVAVVFAIAAVAVHLVFERGGAGFDFVESPAALGILSAYVVAYAIRIYIMNYYKNTRPPGAKLDNQAFFGVEQLAATATLLTFAALVLGASSSLPQVREVQAAVWSPKPTWPLALVSGAAFGVAAFFSVFLFMFKGRTATFAGLVNRLTSLVAGTTSTLVFAVAFGGKLPKTQDWVSLGLILVAVAFLTRAERRRGRERA